MSEDIIIQKINGNEYKKNYDCSIYSTPIQIESYNTVFMTKVQNIPNIYINILEESDTITLFMYIVLKLRLKDSIGTVLQQIEKKGIHRIRIYLWGEDDKVELEGAIDDFMIEVIYRHHIQINNKLVNITLAVKHL